MRIRLRYPSGTTTIAIEDSASISDLQHLISSTTSLPDFDLKYGYPPQPLDLNQFDPHVRLCDAGLKLNGQQLIVVARDIEQQLKHPLHHTSPPEDGVHLLPPIRPESAASQPNKQTLTSPEPPTASELSDPAPQAPAASMRPSPPPAPLSLSRKANNIVDDPPEVPFPNMEGTLVLRVMPDDNSCLFRAVGTAVMGDSLDIMYELRSVVAQQIQVDTEKYNAAVLGMEPDRYCKQIQNPDVWGGAIELSILSEYFQIEICSINVQDLRVDRFNDNEGVESRIILVYSGIHYDTIALSPSDPPYTRATLPPDFDTKVFSRHDDEMLEMARDLCGVLQSKHYYTDTAGFDIKCEICGWTGKGEQAATLHAKETGHYSFGEAG